MKIFKKLVLACLTLTLMFCATGCSVGGSGGNGGGQTGGGDDGVKIGYQFNKNLTRTTKTVYSETYNHSYARIVELEDGTLVSTGEELNNSYGGIPIYRSTDRGKNFVKNASNVHDPNRSATYNAQWQPTLYVLPADFGDFSKGDILLVATSINGGNVNTMTLTVINLYGSNDGGLTWTFVSEITRSTINVSNDQNGCWEGNLILTDEGTLICFYADETDHISHAQRIAFKTTTDGLTWSGVQEAVALTSSSMRPGMPCITRAKDGKYVLVYEIVGETGVPIYCKTSNDGLTWTETDKGIKIQVTEKVLDPITNKERSVTIFPGSSPYVQWTPHGKDANGTLFVSSMLSHYSSGSVPTDASLIDFWVSYDMGANWERVNHPIPYYEQTNRPAYSNSFHFSNDGKSLFVVNSVQAMAGKTNNYLVFVDINIANSMKKI